MDDKQYFRKVSHYTYYKNKVVRRLNFCTAYKAMDIIQHRLVNLYKLHKSEQSHDHIVKKLKSLQLIKEHRLPIDQIIEEQGRFYFITQYYDKSFADLMKLQTLESDQIMRIFEKLYQSCKNLQKLNPSVDCYFNPDNIIINHNCLPLLSEYGLHEIYIQHKNCTKIEQYINPSNLKYLAPEVLNSEKCSKRSIIWTLGVILAELVFQKPIFVDKPYLFLVIDEQRNIWNLLQNKQIKLKSINLQLLKRMLTFKRTERCQFNLNVKSVFMASQLQLLKLQSKQSEQIDDPKQLIQNEEAQTVYKQKGRIKIKNVNKIQPEKGKIKLKMKKPEP